jgi:hypothetical protein
VPIKTKGDKNNMKKGLIKIKASFDGFPILEKESPDIQDIEEAFEKIKKKLR